MTTDNEELFLGIMTGTSMDGMDIVAVTFTTQNHLKIIASACLPYPQNLQQALRNMAQDPAATVTQMCQLDTRLGQFYAEGINQFIEQHSIDKDKIIAIGSHGQTIRHHIDEQIPYSLQIGDPNIIAAKTDLTVVGDFRRKDIALGGQGAPLAPAFHREVFSSDKANRVILNIGGIANISFLPAEPDKSVLGFDTGPGNTLLDYVAQKYFDQAYDKNGEIAASGAILYNKLEKLLSEEPYFSSPAPKSTGTDYFSPEWLKRSGLMNSKPADIMATLSELSAITIADEVKNLSKQVDACYVCGGGAHNHHLLNRLQFHLDNTVLHSTEVLGIHPDWVEATAFAWLARQNLSKKPANLPSVTNAEKFTILGGVYF